MHKIGGTDYHKQKVFIKLYISIKCGSNVHPNGLIQEAWDVAKLEINSEVIS